MNLPILRKLLDGEKFDFKTLAENFEDVDKFWDNWWEGRDLNQIARPEIIEDGDAILQPTHAKPIADLISYSELFNEYLRSAILAERITKSEALLRWILHSEITRIIRANSKKTSDQPKLVFTGGGYGSGKTHLTSFFSKDGDCLRTEHMVGVDYFKLYIPEFNLIQMVGDGRASLTVQEECKVLANELFNELIEKERSFIWDSSMSSQADTEERIKLARDCGYSLKLFAVLTPIEKAIRQAMGRARQTRRFPHPIYLPKSHVDFRKALMAYIPLFDEIMVIANHREDNEPVLIAEKVAGKNELVLADESLFTTLSCVPKST